MKLEDIRALRKAILSAAYTNMAPASTSAILSQQLQSEVEGLKAANAKNSISVGYSFRNQSTDSARLELRVPTNARKAVATAIAIQKEIGKEDVNIRYTKNSITLMDEPEPSKSIKEIDPRSGLLEIGVSIGSANGTGTLGCFAVDDQGQEHLLSCSHVLANHPASIASHNASPNLAGQAVFHPGPQDKKPRNWNAVARLENYTVFIPNGIHNTDSASAILEENIRIAGNIIPSEYANMFKSRTIQQPLADDLLPLAQQGKVFKIGKSSKITAGKISTFGIDASPLEIPSQQPGKKPVQLIFNNLMTIEWENQNSPFSIPGDSGSLVFCEIGEELHALGLVFGTSFEKLAEKDKSYYEVTLVCSLKDILDEHELSWVA